MIAIIDYEAGNLRSVERALKKLEVPCRVTKDRSKIAQSDRIVFPGVGAAGKAMADLNELGLADALRSAFLKGKPILGICLGAQVILEESEENQTPCLGLLRGKVKRFPEDLSEGGHRLKIPHMGWNRIEPVRSHPLFEGLEAADEFYFVHSYYPSPDIERCVIATTCYGIRFPSAIGYRNLVATQFHPEKSGPAGLRILKNFCEWDGHAE